MTVKLIMEGGGGDRAPGCNYSPRLRNSSAETCFLSSEPLYSEPAQHPRADVPPDSRNKEQVLARSLARSTICGFSRLEGKHPEMCPSTCV